MKQEPIDLSAHWKHLPFINVEVYNTQKLEWEQFHKDVLKPKRYYKVTSTQTKVEGFFFVRKVFLNALKKRWDATIVPVASSIDIIMSSLNLKQP